MIAIFSAHGVEAPRSLIVSMISQLCLSCPNRACAFARARLRPILSLGLAAYGTSCSASLKAFDAVAESELSSISFGSRAEMSTLPGDTDALDAPAPGVPVCVPDGAGGRFSTVRVTVAGGAFAPEEDGT